MLFCVSYGRRTVLVFFKELLQKKSKAISGNLIFSRRRILTVYCDVTSYSLVDQDFLYYNSSIFKAEKTIFGSEIATVSFVETFLARLHGVTTYKIVISFCIILLKNSEGGNRLRRYWHLCGGWY